jgi:hypothetical protein
MDSEALIWPQFTQIDNYDSLSALGFSFVLALAAAGTVLEIDGTVHRNTNASMTNGLLLVGLHAMIGQLKTSGIEKGKASGGDEG